RAVVAGPGHRVALPAGIARAGHHERPQAWTELLQPLERRAAVLHAVDVVQLGMARRSGRETVALDPVDRAERHRLGRRVEDRRLVHVVPEAGDAVSGEVL